MVRPWYEKVNRLEELEKYFSEFLDEEVVKNIQYISIRKKFKFNILLVGVNNIKYKNNILDYAPRILLQIKKHQENKTTKGEEWGNRIPNKLEVFEYSLEKAEERKALLKKWKADPLSCFEHTEQENMIADDLSYFVKDNKIFYIDNKWGSDTYLSFALHEFIIKDFKKYDFIALDWYKKEWHYVEHKGQYIKYIPPLNLRVHASDNVGFCELKQENVWLKT